MPSRRARGSEGRGGEARRRGTGPSRHARMRLSARTYPASAAATSTSDTSRVNAARRVSARFSSSCRALVSSSRAASETRQGKKNGGRPEATRCAQTDRTTEGVSFRLSLFPHRVSYEHQSFVLYFFLFRNFDASRGYFVSTRVAFPPDGTCPARLHERRTRSPFHDSSSSSLEVERTPLELLCSAPQRSRLRPKSTDCPFPRLLGSLASPPPGPPVRAPFSVSGARTLPAIASRVARSSATSSVRRSSVPTRPGRVSRRPAWLADV